MKITNTKINTVIGSDAINRIYNTFYNDEDFWVVILLEVRVKWIVMERSESTIRPNIINRSFDNEITNVV